MNTPRRLALVALAVLGLLSFAGARAEDTVVETWDRIHLAGGHAGAAHTTVKRVGGDVPRVETTVRVDLSMKRMGQATEIVTTSQSWETPDGAPLQMSSVTKMSAQETRTVTTFAPGKVTIETTLMGNTRTVEKAVPPDLVGPARAEELQKALAGTTGKTIEVLSFIPDYQSAVRTTLTSKGPEKVTLHDGTSAELTRVETTMTMVDGTPIPMNPVLWLDAQGTPRKTSVNAAGMAMESFRVADEAAARAEGPAKGPAPDVFEASVLKEDGPIPTPRRLDEATIVITKRRAGVTLPQLADAGHRVTEREDGSLLVHARRMTPAAGKEGVRPRATVPPEVADCLAASSMVQSDAPEIAAAAKEAVGGETNAWKAAQKIERWVFDTIAEKNMNTAFASALEVCKTREGDCTEHAVLLAALCRASGIPARVVMGVEYVLGIWGGHAWNEVWIEGEWFPLDATNGLGFVDPLHLPMARMTMKEGAGAEFVQLLGGLGNIDVDVIEVVRDGRRIAVDDPALVSAEGGAYRNAVLGLAFKVPPGFEIDLPRRPPAMDTKLLEVDGKTAEGASVEIEVNVMDAPADPDWAKFFAQFRVDPADVTPGQVDGREARVVRRIRGKRSEIRVVVPVDGAFWVFELDRADGAPERAAFDVFLASVDFDVK